MIQSKKDLIFYLAEDAKRFKLNSWIKYQVKLIYGSEDAHILRYLKTLWRYEYYHNCSNNVFPNSSNVE